MRDPRLLASIFAGGAVGTLLRTLLAVELPFSTGEWPWPTFVANVVGCFALGYIAARLHERLPSAEYKHPLLATGFCGALTTFSTFQLELARMVEDGYVALAIAYLTASVAVGLLALATGAALERRTRSLA